jgi:hypothetical protein
MNIFKVRKVIDSSITKDLLDNKSFIDIISDIIKRKNNISNMLRKELGSDSLYEIVINTKNVESLNLSKRALYAYYYITQADKRINDLYWLSCNKKKFTSQKSTLKIYNLFLFTEKLKENSYYIQ